MTLTSEIDKSAENSFCGVSGSSLGKDLEASFWVGVGRRANEEAFGPAETLSASFTVKHLGQWRYKYGVIVHGFGKVDVFHDRCDLP